MFQIIQNQILFFLALAFVMFLPGWCLMLAVFKKSQAISLLERFIISFAMSIISLDFILFTYNKLNISITALSIILGILIFSGVCFGIYKTRANRGLTSNNEEETSQLFSFSKNQFILLLLLLFLTVFIKTAYLSGSIAPTTTDLGHHTYWAKTIAETHKLTDYEGMPDFIIGEHTVFASIYLLTGLSFFSGWPVVILYLINLLGILTVFILTLRIFENKLIAILSILFLGVLYAVSAPQAKYVSGGVMGNIFGNFLLPLALYFYYRSFEFLSEKNNVIASEAKQSRDVQNNLAKNEITTVAKLPRNDSVVFLTLAVFTTFGLFYTHHLTSFIFLFAFLLLIPLFVIVNYKDIETILKKASKVIFSPWVIGVFLFGLVYFFFVFTPTYVNPKAIDTAVGTATKSTRVGLTINDLTSTVGEPRLALGFLGFIILLLGFKRKNFGFSLLTAWTFMLFIMSLFPNLIFVDLPSNRIGNYITYPLAILSAYAFYIIFHPESYKFLWGKKICDYSEGLMLDKLTKGAFLLLLAFVMISGVSDSVQAFKNMDNLKDVNQTFSSSAYLAKNTADSDMILKDHNYITADSWMKHFFMRGYKYPQSRGYFKRYEDTGNRSDDPCTLLMISNPGGDPAKKCFADTGTDFIMVNPQYDSGQFQRLSEFNQVYMSPEVGIYYKK